VTFLFTDIQGSTTLWDRQPVLAAQMLRRHDELVESIVAAHSGRVVRPRGEGDSRFAVFARASDAVSAAGALQIALAGEAWPVADGLLVRMALHTGETELRAGDYYGTAVNRCARLRSIAHGGQTLLSDVTANLVRQSLTTGVNLRDLGSYRLKGLDQPERVWQLVQSKLASDFPPLLAPIDVPHNLPS